MRNVKWGLFLVASLLIGPSVAWACPVLGTVVCEGTDQPVEGVVLTFTEGGTSRDAPATDAGGDFTLDLWGADWDVYLGSDLLTTVTVWDINGQPWTLADPIEVPASLVPECGSQPGCVLTGVTEGPFTTEDGRPIGNPDAECDSVASGSVSIGGGFNGTLEAPLASMDAAFAIVKSGRNFYSVTVDVQEGDALILPDTKNAVSHVTYCSCPPEEASSSAALSASTDNTAGGCSSGSAGALALLGLAAVLPRLRRRRN